MTPRIVSGMGLDLNMVNTNQADRNAQFRVWAGSVISSLQSAGVTVKVQWEGGTTGGVYLLPLSARLTLEAVPGHTYVYVLTLTNMDLWVSAPGAAKELINKAKFQAAREGGPSTYIPPSTSAGAGTGSGKVPATTEKTTAETVREQVEKQAAGGTEQPAPPSPWKDMLSSPVVLIVGGGLLLWLLTRGK